MDYTPGQILLFAFSHDMPNLLPCDGRILPIAQYQALFSELGVSFGGNGITDFALPNYTELVPKGSTYFIVVQSAGVGAEAAETLEDVGQQREL